MNFFDKIVEWLDGSELSFVTFLSKITPLLVPLIPAYVGYSHVTRELGFDPFFGVTYGAVIEFLGYASIYKAVQFWENNRRYTSKENQAPLFVAIVIYLAYLLVTLAVNVLLDYQSGVVWWKVTATGAISLLSVPAGLLMSVSAIHTERTIVRQNRRKNRTNEEPVRRTKHRTRRTNTPNEQRTRIEDYIERTQANEQRTPGASEIANELGVAKSYAWETLQIVLGDQEKDK